MTIEEIITTNPVGRLERERRRRKVKSRFKRFLPESCPEPWDLMLYPFTITRPLKYLDMSNVAELGIFFEKNRDTVLAALPRFSDAFSRAIATMMQPGPTWNAEHDLKLGAVQGSAITNSYAGFDTVWHPQYQRYTEHVFNHLINIPLAVLEEHSGKSYCNQALPNRVELLKKKLEIDFIFDGYDAIVRNAISHGHIKYALSEIEYRNSPEAGAKTRKLSANNFARLFDKQIASCNEIVAALILFMLHYWGDVKALGLEKLPLGMIQLALSAAGTNKGFTITNLIESEESQGLQLIISCSTSTQSRVRQKHMALQLAALAQDLSGSRYIRFGIEFDCQRTVTASIYINGVKLQDARNDENAGSLDEIFEQDLLWFDVPPWRARLEIMISLFSHTFRDGYERSLEEQAARGVFSNRFYDIRATSVVGGKSPGLELKAVLKDDVTADRETLETIALKIVKAQRWRPRFKTKLGGRRGALQLPTYIRLYIYEQDGVLRNLKGRVDHGALVEGEWCLNGERYTFPQEPHALVDNLRLRFAQSVLLSGEMVGALDSIAQRLANTRNLELEDLNLQAEQAVQEIVYLLEGAENGLAKFWLDKEIERYQTWNTLLRPSSQAVTKLIADERAVSLDDLNNLFEDSTSVLEASALKILGEAIHLFVSQIRFIEQVESELRKDIASINAFSALTHDLMDRVMSVGIDPGRAQTGLSSIFFDVLEDTLFLRHTEEDQIEVMRSELGQAIGRCELLLPKYSEDIHNGADLMIKEELQEVRAILRSKTPDLLEMQVLYSSLFITPYIMLSVVRRRFPDFNVQ